MARETSGCCPPPMAMEREVNEVPAKLKEGPGRGANPECNAMEKEVNPVPKGNGGGRSDRIGGYRGGQSFKERREEIRAKKG